ncbi:MAG: VOC family protein [Mariniphaga sp.]
MKPRINVITLGVDDLEKSKAFYRRALGWEPAKGSDENIVFYNHGGIVLSLYPFEKLADDAGLPAHKSEFPGITLSINQKNKEAVDEVYKQAIKNGAKDLIKPHETFWGGYGGYFADPDGYPWEVAWAPFWEFDKQGSLKI